MDVSESESSDSDWIGREEGRESIKASRETCLPFPLAEDATAGEGARVVSELWTEEAFLEWAGLRDAP